MSQLAFPSAPAYYAFACAGAFDARAQHAVPVGLLEGGKVTAPIRKGELLTRANAALDQTTRLFALRQKQDQMFGILA